MYTKTTNSKYVYTQTLIIRISFSIAPHIHTGTYVGAFLVLLHQSHSYTLGGISLLVWVPSWPLFLCKCISSTFYVFFFGLKNSMQKSLFYFIRYIPHHRLHVIVYFVIPLPYQVQNSTRESQLCFIRKHYNCSKLPLNLLFGLFRLLLLLLHLHRIIEKKSELN